MRARQTALAVVLTLAVLPSLLAAQVCNLKVVTDASPDYSDLPSLIHSVASNWQTSEEKCWAMFYWNHIARRQTSPMILHGRACTDPIRQFNDYGYTMCSTIAGINCSLWDAMGLKTRYWDISNHTVSECFYDGRWHIYDNSMSAIYTLCDGKTIAGVEDVGKPGACEASGGKTEPGHIARYHCLNATSPQGFLTGADCPRSLQEEYRCFNPNGLKYRSYFYDWDRGHRYILNLKEGETYTRHYHRLGNEPKYYVPNHSKDPDTDAKGTSRYRLRANGVWVFKPKLTPADLPKVAYSMSNVRAVEPAGIEPVKAEEPGEVTFKIDGANVITGMTVKSAGASRVLVSTTNGLDWREVWKAEAAGSPAQVDLAGEVNGAYEALVKFELAAGSQLSDVQIETITQLNSKTQPRLNLGKNTVYVGTGDQSGSIVLCPDLQGENARPMIVEQKNVVFKEKHPGYMGVLHAERPNKDAYVVFRIDSPQDLVRLTYGGRFYNRAPKSHIDLLHSFDGGKTWSKTYSLTDTQQPWDVIHYETVDQIPPGTKSVLFKYLLNGSAAGTGACSIYAARMEASYKPADPGFKPVEVTYCWNEVQKDGSKVQRSHTELVAKTPHVYTINVGGEDHPVMESLAVKLHDASTAAKLGYSDGRDAGGEKFVSHWVAYGKNLAVGKPYTVSIPSATSWGSGDPEGKKLTDGIVGPPYAGGITFSYGLLWNKGQKPEITVDLGSPQSCGAFRIHLTGYPWWDAMKGQVKDRIEVLTSTDGKEYTSRGQFNTNLRWKDIPANHMWPDEEEMTGPVLDLETPQPVEARYVRFVLSPERSANVSEVQVLDKIQRKPFDLRLALPQR